MHYSSLLERPHSPSDMSESACSKLFETNPEETLSASGEPSQNTQPGGGGGPIAGIPQDVHSINIVINQHSVQIPQHLPINPAPQPSVNLQELILDPDFMEEGPVGFVLNKMYAAGEPLLNDASSTRLNIPRSKILPPHLHCQPSSNARDDYVEPTHILCISTSDSTRQLLVPVHGFFYAALSPHLSCISSAPEHQPLNELLPSERAPSIDPTKDEMYLPVIKIRLPHSASVIILHHYMYLKHPQRVIDSLIPAIPPNVPVPPNLAGFIQALAQNFTTQQLLERIHLTHGLWQNVVKMGVSDEPLWVSMARSWMVLVAALGVTEDVRRRDSINRTIQEVVARGGLDGEDGDNMEDFEDDESIFSGEDTE